MRATNVHVVMLCLPWEMPYSSASFTSMSSRRLLSWYCVHSCHTPGRHIRRCLTLRMSHNATCTALFAYLIHGKEGNITVEATLVSQAGGGRGTG